MNVNIPLILPFNESSAPASQSTKDLYFPWTSMLFTSSVNIFLSRLTDVSRLIVSTLGIISFKASAYFGSTSALISFPSISSLSRPATEVPAAFAIACKAIGRRSPICKRSSSELIFPLLIIWDKAKNTPLLSSALIPKAVTARETDSNIFRCSSMDMLETEAEAVNLAKFPVRALISRPYFFAMSTRKRWLSAYWDMLPETFFNAVDTRLVSRATSTNRETRLLNPIPPAPSAAAKVTTCICMALKPAFT